jgi:hypothetical protein
MEGLSASLAQRLRRRAAGAGDPPATAGDVIKRREAGLDRNAATLTAARTAP